MRHRLHIRIPGLSGIRVNLRGDGPWVVGSSPECEIPIRARGVSRKHLRLAYDSGGKLFFKDLGSTNGTYVDGSPLGEGELRHGNVLSVGETAIVIEEDVTDSLSLKPTMRSLSTSSVMEAPHLKESRGVDGVHRRFDILTISSSIESLLQDSSPMKPWEAISGIFGENLGLLSVYCYEVHPSGAILKTTWGKEIKDQAMTELAKSCALFKDIRTFEKGEGGREPLRLITLPIFGEGLRLVLVGFFVGKGDPIMLHPEALLFLPVLFRMILSWSEQLDEKVVSIEKLKRTVKKLHEKPELRVEETEPIIGKSKALKNTLSIADRAALVDVPILLQGPTGSGKELFAKRIHSASKRAKRPLITINCAAIPEELLESELFGATKGAYTGAVENRKGLFVAADRGTMFLDEIAELPLRLQPKILRVLEDKLVTPLGSTESHHVDVRIISASNREISEMVTTGQFRNDLYYRLAGFVIDVPPLSKRREDIPALAEAFLKRANKKFEVNVEGFTDEALAILMAQAWPGNVRQLLSAVDRLVIMADGPSVTKASVEALIAGRGKASGRAEPRDGYFDMPWSEARTAFEKAYFSKRLSEKGQNLANLSKELGISRPTLYAKLRLLGLKLPDKGN